jgi:hypothetical protein
MTASLTLRSETPLQLQTIMVVLRLNLNTPRVKDKFLTVRAADEAEKPAA